MHHFKLRDYQEEIINSIVYYLENNDRCCVSLATGGGKTVIFSELTNRFQGRILICVHREELVYQTSKTLQVEHDLLIPKTKHINKKVCIAMVQTLNNRIKKGYVNINDFDYIIVDEAHRGEFMKILNKFNGMVVGFTATPNYEKNIYFWKCLSCGMTQSKSGECCKRKTQKYRQNIPLKKYYHKLIEGISISKLIKKGFLVPDENFVLDVDTSRLVYDEFKNDYTEESIGLVFGSDEAINNTIRVYKELALNRKTIIFNPNTLVNKKLFEAMLSEGLNVKLYDSNNSEENRHDLIEWFKNTPNAVLLNVQIFTTGFDCTDVEVIFLNKKTKSINLFLQMVGRGGRITDKIFKPSFKVIDMGNNAEDFGRWSDERNWNYMFSRESIKEVGKSQPSAVRICHNCEGVVAANSLICPLCKTERLYVNGSGVVGLPKRDGKVIIPSPNKIIEYCLKNNLDCLDARKIVYNFVASMFDEVPYSVYYKHAKNDSLFQKTQNFIKPYYFAIQKSELKGNKIRKLYHFTNQTIRTIEKKYDNTRKHNSSRDIQVVSQ